MNAENSRWHRAWSVFGRMAAICIFSGLFSGFLWGQPASSPCQDCECLIAKAKRAQESGEFDKAISLYIAARGYCPDFAADIDSSMLKVFQSIDNLRKRANKAQAQAESAQDSLYAALTHTRLLQARINTKMSELQNAKWISDSLHRIADSERAKSDSLLNSSRQLISAFYFFEDSLALAFQNGKFGYVNKQGNPIVEYKYDKAENFMQVGMARVKQNGYNYLVDRAGNEYFVDGMGIFNTPKFGLDLKLTVDFRKTRLSDFIYRILYCRKPPRQKTPRKYEKVLLRGALFSKLLTPKYMRHHVRSLDLSGWGMRVINERTFQLLGLRVLLLSDNRLKELSPRFIRLKELRVLDLSRNMLRSLPDGFSNLSNLVELDLSNNQLREFPMELLKIPNLKRVYLQGNPFIRLSDLGCLQETLTQFWPNCVWKFE